VCVCECVYVCMHTHIHTYIDVLCKQNEDQNTLVCYSLTESQKGLEFRVSGLGFRLEFRVSGLGFRLVCDTFNINLVFKLSHLHTLTLRFAPQSSQTLNPKP